MDRFWLTPRWVALHLAMVLAVVACLLLGQWQWNSYSASQSQEGVRDQPAVALPSLLEPSVDLADVVDRRVSAVGTYTGTVVVSDREHDGVLGDEVADVLRTEDGSLLVLRGWSADAASVPSPTGTVEVVGHLQPPEPPEAAVTAGAEPAVPGTMTYLDPALIGQALPGTTGQPVLPGYLVQESEQPAAVGASLVPLDIDEVAPVNDVSPWQNLSYWAQWWVFAAGAVLFWASALRSAARDRRAALSDAPRAPAPAR